jgi:hypothetical protein
VVGYQFVLSGFEITIDFFLLGRLVCFDQIRYRSFFISNTTSRWSVQFYRENLHFHKSFHFLVTPLVFIFSVPSYLLEFFTNFNF